VPESAVFRTSGGRASFMVEPASARAQSVIAGKYRLEHELGAGAMGTVWLATHLTLGQQVAVKLISRQLANSKEARQRFDTEAKSAAKLRSRFAVQVYDNGETEDGTPYIVMEYLEGEPLDRRIQRDGPIPIGDTVRMISQVGRALARAHTLNIVHRDLKPANIFLARSHDEGEVAKVLDFGIAKVGGIGAESATQTGAVLGTPLFMSPEQVRGLRSVDYRTDLYSLGMVAFNALTGKYAFSGESFGDLLLGICTLPLPALHEAAPWLPPTLNDWFQHACARDPAQRFASAEAMIEALLLASGMSATRLSMLDGVAPIGGRATPPTSAVLAAMPSQAMPSQAMPSHALAQSAGAMGVGRPSDMGSGGIGTSSVTVPRGVPTRIALFPLLLVAFGLAGVIFLGAGAWWLKKRFAAGEEPMPIGSGDTTASVAPTGEPSATLATTGGTDPTAPTSATATVRPPPSATSPSGVKTTDRRPSLDRAPKPEKSAQPQPTGKPGKRPIDVGF
jgi:eukaryotic-like serine/threonine-protein kinase